MSSIQNFRFTFTNDEGEKMEIAFGSDSNEEPKDGESATQFPREYLIETETTRCHLIDTPGIGDSRGTEQEEFSEHSDLSNRP